MTLVIVEPDISDLTVDVEALRKQIWLVVMNLKARDEAMANVNYSEFDKMLKDVRTKMDRIQRKLDDFEANSAS